MIATRFRNAWHALIEEYRPDALLFLVHDYAATYYWDILLRDLYPPVP
jgi:hypothetical protein